MRISKIKRMQSKSNNTGNNLRLNMDFDKGNGAFSPGLKRRTAKKP